MKKEFYAFLIPVHSSHEERWSLPHQMRDGSALLEIVPELIASGWEYQGQILNYPPPDEGDTFVPPEGSVLVIPTRLEIPERSRNRRRRRVDCSNNALERSIVKRLQDVFVCCERDHIVLESRIARLLPREWQNRHSMEFMMYGHEGRYLKEYQASNLKKSLAKLMTAHFYVHLMPTRACPWEIVNFFGISGLQTLSWAHILKGRIRKGEVDISRQCLIINEAAFPPVPVMPQTLDFLSGWKNNSLTLDIK